MQSTRRKTKQRQTEAEEESHSQSDASSSPSISSDREQERDSRASGQRQKHGTEKQGLLVRSRSNASLPPPFANGKGKGKGRAEPAARGRISLPAPNIRQDAGASVVAENRIVMGSSSSSSAASQGPVIPRKRASSPGTLKLRASTYKATSRRAQPDLECRVCGAAEEEQDLDRLLSCAECGKSVHPIDCGHKSERLARVAQKYPWRCQDCKICEDCMDIGNSKNRLFPCAFCDRGWHGDCVIPAIRSVNERFQCPKCAEGLAVSVSPLKTLDTSQPTSRNSKNGNGIAPESNPTPSNKRRGRPSISGQPEADSPGSRTLTVRPSESKAEKRPRGRPPLQKNAIQNTKANSPPPVPARSPVKQPISKTSAKRRDVISDSEPERQSQSGEEEEGEENEEEDEDEEMEVQEKFQPQKQQGPIDLVSVSSDDEMGLAPQQKASLSNTPKSSRRQSPAKSIKTRKTKQSHDELNLNTDSEDNEEYEPDQSSDVGPLRRSTRTTDNDGDGDRVPTRSRLRNVEHSPIIGGPSGSRPTSPAKRAAPANAKSPRYLGSQNSSSILGNSQQMEPTGLPAATALGPPFDGHGAKRPRRNQLNRQHEVPSISSLGTAPQVKLTLPPKTSHKRKRPPPSGIDVASAQRSHKKKPIAYTPHLPLVSATSTARNASGSDSESEELLTPRESVTTDRVPTDFDRLHYNDAVKRAEASLARGIKEVAPFKPFRPVKVDQIPSAPPPPLPQLENGIANPNLKAMRVRQPIKASPSFLESDSAPGTPTGALLPDGAYSNVRQIVIGERKIDIWYQAPYPEEVARVPQGTLWLCEWCLKYLKTGYQLERHRKKCATKHPPGDEIYRDGQLSVWEIDGRKSKIYCQNLCLLSKMFLDHKTLYYDVDPFLFYVMTEHDFSGSQFIGYFSKEKRSPTNNLSCIMTLPVRQQGGYGQFLVDFSYLLSRKEDRVGTPEQPLSDLGLVLYFNYWKTAIYRYVLAHPNDEFRIEDFSKATGMRPNDVYWTLSQLHAIRIGESANRLDDPEYAGWVNRFNSHRTGGLARPTVLELDKPLPKIYRISFDMTVVEEHVEAWTAKATLRIDESRLKWYPYLYNRGPMIQPLPPPSIPRVPLIADDTDELDEDEDAEGEPDLSGAGEEVVMGQQDSFEDAALLMQLSPKDSRTNGVQMRADAVEPRSNAFGATFF